ncbi:uncharacterized protein LOC113229942 [Hyposmocoma kahamanoa]|uniref:uncharacterized protein LOC113229942 n=1 Tax=Hyposmocoma kahamanoa TaxID=1477025 RepID=UPI000E6D779F|nr:uncharacterized protein LOC113229942 [Hyposmocoma kahamanoa]
MASQQPRGLGPDGTGARLMATAVAPPQSPAADSRSRIHTASQYNGNSARGCCARAPYYHSRTRVPLDQRCELRRGGMAQGSRGVVTGLAALLAVAIAAQHLTAHAQTPTTAEKSIAKDRTFRLSAGRKEAQAPKWGFFGTIFHLILEQINDTKSAYNQISDLVGNQFTDDNTVTPEPNPSNDGSTETPKISRQEFLNILDRNLKGLARLRALEWREARKDSWKNLQGYKDELFGSKRSGRKR